MTSFLRHPFRRRRRLELLIAVVVFATLDDVTSGEMASTPFTFAFTRPSYNTSLVENAPGKSYLQPTEPRMGIVVGPPDTSPIIDVAFNIVEGDSTRLFKAESRRVGDFCFVALRTRSGVLASINREQADSYRLVVSASSKFRGGGGLQLTARAEVFVTVMDANDLSPLFDQSEYRVEVPEGTPLHRSVARVTASDADIGVNGEIYYGFAQTGGVDTGTFSIHPTSGVVTVARRLTAADRSTYELEILAKDRGQSSSGDRGSGRVARAWMYITVVSENLHRPEILVNELPAVVEHGAVGTIYAILVIKDKDYGRGGQLDTVRIASGDPDGYFRVQPSAVDPSEYVVEVVKVLDRESHAAGFNLTIEAVDRGRPPLTGSTSIQVRLQDVNDNTPVFVADVFSIQVDECLPVNTVVLSLAALDGDSGENGRVTYSIEDPGAVLFNVGSSSGVLFIASQLDAESMTRVNITVVAADHANLASRRLGSAVVQVEIVDCNDNSPVFGAIQTAYIDENQPPSTLVYQVQATDADHSENGFVSYSLVNGDGLPFVIDPFTGKISTTESLDFESMPHAYNLLIRASDWGTPFHREAEAVVRVKVRDANDNRPQFERVNCSVYLSRDTSPGAEIIVASAIDFDKSSVVSYRILSGNEDDCFEIDPTTGQLKTKSCTFGVDSRLITITASDGLNEAESMSINITFISSGRSRRPTAADLRLSSSSSCQETHVAEELMRLDGLRQNLERTGSGLTSSPSDVEPNRFSRNLHAPRFSSSALRKLNVREGSRIGNVANFTAIDEDHGYSGRLLYVISTGNDGEVFDIDTYSGILNVTGRIDRELRDRYLLNITVFDMGVPPRSASMLADIAVEDVNDNAPVFERVTYAVGIPENVAEDTAVVTVIAHDKDLGANGRVTYHLMTNEDTFAIDSATGVVKVIAAVDRETTSRYELVVVAVDSSSDEALSGTTVITVRVDDVNDNAPAFVSDTNSIRVLEDLPVGTVVATLYARDPDLGSSGTVRYSLMDGADGFFEVDRSTGIIRLAKELVFDSRQLFNITAQAKDRGLERQLSSRCQLLIEVVPIHRNLYAPQFRDYVFQGRVRENQPPGTSVMQLMANDKDYGLGGMSHPQNYQIKYSIRNGTGLGRFGIDNKGTIFTKDVLDRETQAFYWLTVYAQDSGVIPLSSFTEVFIEVDDVNDNVPQTADPVYYPTVLEGSPEGTSVLRLEASDQDSTANGALTYEITSGNPQGFFAINRTNGLITTTKRILDREKQDEHILEVTVYDNGVPSLSSATRIVVGVTDDNDESPQFLDRQYRVRVPRLPVARLTELGVYRVTAYDRDIGPNGDIDYSLSGERDRDRGGRGGGVTGRFRIGSKTGMIYATREMEDSQYDFVVKAADNGKPQQRTSVGVRLTVVDVPSTSPNAPTFTTTSATSAPAPGLTGVDSGTLVRLMESDEVGSLVTIVSAEDPDGDKIWYYVVGGNTDETFSIDTENGNIILARRLDRETCHEYNLTIMATDGVHQAYTAVSVSVLDISDNSPVFDQSTYVADIAENASPGTEVVVLRATDRDEDKQLFYTIHSASSPGSLSKFKINSETGVITTLEELNHEATSRHELTVMVRDSGTRLPKRGFARVIFNVIDHNDHAPEFLSAEYEGHVFSTAAAGTSVLQVQALDRDKGINAQVTYSILSGNVGSAFSIDRTLGLVTVSSVATLDKSSYRLVVGAADQGSPSLSSSATVSISIATSNAAAPVFDVDELFVDVAENQPEGFFIASVHASCQSSVTYSLVDENTSSRFNIDPSSGVVFAGPTPLDHELSPHHNVTIRAVNFAGVFSTAALVVHVTDVNDNRPKFIKRSYTGTIIEASQIGTEVLEATPGSGNRRVPLMVRATDADSGLNALLTYRIVGTRAAELFEINSETGAVRTKVVLDREISATYHFGVQVSDSGVPPRSAEFEANVTILVEDINDTPPVFPEQIYRAKLLLPTHPGVMVTRVLATDADQNATIEYAIDSSVSRSFPFSVNASNGVIVVSSSASDTEMQSSYDVPVTASDGKYVGRSVVHIEVENLQSSGLKFSQSEYDVEIVENSTGIQPVVLLQAVGQLLNEHLSFTLLNGGDLFTVHPTSGAVRTTGSPFDRERRSEYSIVAEVRDGRSPPRVAHSIVRVAIVDINDNPPVFIHQPYFAVVSVDSTVGSLVRKVTAVDRDFGNNSVVEYHILGGNGAFDIRKDTGEIIVNGSLLETEQYHLTVEARDKGDNVLSSQAEAVITVVNKAMPIFDEAFYSASVPENMQPFTAILTVSARSPMGNALVYSIVAGDEYGEFSVDFNIGAISLIDQLDYETNKNYQLTIRASDVISRSFADITVRILVEDVNDNEPVFETTQYTVDLSEAAPIGTSILTVSAKDADSGSNARLRYLIESLSTSSSDSNYFYVDSERGIILLRQRVDREQVDRLKFAVVAVDSGLPTLSATSVVTVNVTDVNDNAPKFDQPAYEASISDRARRGQFVVAVRASDSDISNRGQLMYAIVGGNTRQSFAVESRSGVISVSNTARRLADMPSSYILNVSATDGIYTTFARVRVLVEGSNAHAPVFAHAVYDVDVAENQPSGFSVISVSATDNDRGEFGNVTHRILNEDADELFVIDPKTGSVSTKAALDRESKDVHEIRVSATDGGGRKGYTLIRVHVTDEGDHEPLFSAGDYKANVYASAHIGTTVFQVSVSDQDLDNNREVQYALVADDSGSASASQYFSIGSRNGVIMTNASLVGVEKETFQFFVRASNSDNTPRHTDVPVEIYVMGAADRVPVFDQELYRFNIVEDSPPGTTVASVTAHSEASIHYNIVAEQNGRLSSFAIDHNGVVTTVEQLDRERADVYELTLRAETWASPPLVTHTRFIVHVTDVNDNAPQFETDLYQAVIAENGVAGAQVMQVIARDRDTGTNGEFVYQLEAQHARLFNIDPRTGWIITAASLDRESASEFRLLAIAVDRGTPRMSSTAQVVITIGDENDNAPEFVQGMYSGAVNEDALPGTIILVVAATDADVSPNNVVSYNVAGGDPLGQFGVRRSGELYVNKILDREDRSNYELMVVATDGAFVSTATVSISILDANDNAPICDQLLYTVDLMENVAVGSYVTRVSATDADEPGTRNSRIEFSLESDDLELFSIHKKSGVITTKRLLDRETVPDHRLTVVAVDGGGLTCRSQVHVVLTDVNDNAPKFTSRGVFTATIPEDSAVGTPVVRVAAFDSDLGINRRVRYSLVAGEGDSVRSSFQMDSVSGVLTLLQTVDREERPVYNFTVMASDQGSPRLTSLATVVITILDINDNPPEFERTMYSMSVNEAVQVGTSIGRVFATSRDVGINAEITYSVVATMGNDFSVDSDTGAIVVSGSLDYELIKEYIMTIEACDGGTPSLSTTAMVKIDITDANDNRPIFVQQDYQAVVREDVAVNTSLLQVEAVDSDVGVNGRVEYRIIGGDSHKQFTINITHGHLSVTAPLDREVLPSYELIVAAIDGGVPSLTSSTVVKIQLLDANDSPPQFSNTNFTATIQAEASLGTSVFVLSVTDPDLDPNGPPFIYDVIAGNQDEFYVDRNGVVRTATKFNRQIKDHYRLTIRVYDNGIPPLFSEVSLDAVVVEESASPPVITPLAVTVTVAGESYPGGDIGRVRATDRDIGDQLLFAIVRDEDRGLFDIDAVDGTLRAVQAIDVGEYIVNISVTDGRFSRFADARVTVEGIAQEAQDNAVVVRIDGLTTEEFVEHHLQGFILALRSELAVRESGIKILSIQPASNVFGVRRRRSEADSSVQQVDVLLAVQRTDSKYFRGNALKRRIESVARAVEQQADVHIVRVFNNVCNKESCLNGDNESMVGADCVTVVSLDGDTPVTIVTDSESFVSVKHQLTRKCVCRPGSPCGTQSTPKDICSPGLCREPKICRSDGQSYMCVCPEGRAGEECRDLIEPPCNDLACRKDKPMTFSGSSFVRWRLTVPMERRLSLSLELRTVQKKARLMHAVGRVDYSILEIEDGMVQYRFDCGSGPGIIRVDKMLINDGYWHTVAVERISKSVRVIIDGIHVGEGSGPGPNDLLNLDGNDVFFGAEVEQMAHGAFDEVRNGFVGCMQRIRIDLVDLPLLGGSSVAVLHGMQDIEFHCRGIYIPGVCSSSPCHNGGSCLPQSADSYLCRCRGRFSGHHCDIDTNPCASSPCLNGGTCENLANDYRCTCPSRVRGARCEHVPFCDPNPCRNGAPCTEDAIGPLCECPKGFTGEMCELDIDECLSNPCNVLATCQNLVGGYLCNCSSGTACVDGYTGKILSSSIGLNWEEAVGIAAVILTLLITALIIVFVMRYRRRRIKHRQMRSHPTDPTVFGTCEVDNDIGSISDKASCTENGRRRLSANDNCSVSSRPSPRLAAGPSKRPVSCSFGTGNSSGGAKFDSPMTRTMDYGSAGDELEITGREPQDQFPNFVRNPDVAAKSPQFSHKNPLAMPITGSKQEPSPRGLNNLNKAEYYRNKHQDKLRKVIPTGAGNQSTQSLQLLPEGASVSDLAISESEDDMQGLYWDTSDWNPAAEPLLLMNGDVRVSPTSSHHSTDYNVDIDPTGYDATDIEDQFDPADDSEYVGDDSEFTENECDDGFEGYNDEEPNVGYPPPAASASLDFQQILAMRDELNYGTEGRDKSKKQQRRNGAPKRSASSAGHGVHPNMYLPTYNISMSGSVANDDGSGSGGAEPDGLNGNFTSADFISRDDDDDVLQWGFPASASLLRPRRNERGSKAKREAEETALDNMSMSGCRSMTNDSELDLAGVCEIEDSEANFSDDDTTAVYPRRKLNGKPSTAQTKV